VAPVKKSEQIRALQAECDRLMAERDACRAALTVAHAEAKARRQDPPSLVDQARSEFYRKWDWLLEAVGFGG
jgi:outer membrane murein-binding lipoprotein Lpp